ncbi:MAG: ABC transporter permease [Bacillota bacterium]|jgi:putative ABC transport system permease protein
MLWRKTIRDLNDNRGACAACLVVIVIGLMIYTLFSILSDNLKASQRDFYAQHNFADGFAEIQGMPLGEVQRLRNIEGIDRMEGRLIKEARVLLPGREENVFLRLISLDLNEENPLNSVELMEGRPLREKDLEMWVDNAFFAANNLELNDEITVLIAGKRQQLRLVGMGRSPEFVYALRGSGDLFPSPETFGVAFLPWETMKKLFQEGDRVNNLIFTLLPGADYEDVELKLEAELKKYGLINIYPREDQVSHQILIQELEGLEVAAKAVPLLFLSIAGAILYIMLKRMVEQQRGQIGVLKGFGYTDREIISHYLLYAMIIGFAGGLMGAFLGLALARPFTKLYEMFFNMPSQMGMISPVYSISGSLLSTGIAALAGYGGCRSVLSLQPAAAMRPPGLPVGKKILLEKLPFVWNMLTIQGKMAVRNIIRNKGRSLFVFLGIMVSFSLVGFTWSMNDLVQMMLYDQYEKVETYDVKIIFSRPLKQDQVYGELIRFPGMNSLEPMAEVPVTLKNQWLEKDVLLLGIPAGGQHYRILDAGYRQLAPPRDGILLSERLAKLLDAEPGTWLQLESPFLPNNEETKAIRVAGVIPQYLGINAYMELGALQDFLHQGKLVTAFTAQMDSSSISSLKNRYRDSAVVNEIVETGELMKKTRELMDSFGSMIYFYAFLGIVIGFAIIYNSAVITLAERNRELATMMVMGMTAQEVLSVITFEQWFLGFFGMAAAIPLSYLMLAGMSEALSTDVYTIPSRVTPLSFLISLLVTAGAIWLAQRAAARKVHRLSLVQVLKSIE